MRARDVRSDKHDRKSVIRALVRGDSWDREDFRLECSWLRKGSAPEVRAGDALLAYLLLPAMASGETLDLSPLSVSSKLLEGVPSLQQLYRSWSKGISRVDVVASSHSPGEVGGGTALYFSGGVDSWYSLLTADSEGYAPTHLLFLMGFDIERDQHRRAERALATASEAARSAGAELVVASSNVRELSDPVVDWRLYHGSYLAGTALALGGELSRCFIPATNSPESLRSWGSHPVLDAMWGTETLEFAHSGFRATRLAKLKTICEHEIALRTLRVCWQPVDEYNCGRCPKCSLTMVGLHLLDKLREAESFPDSIDLEVLATVDASVHGMKRTTVLEMLPLAEARQDTAIVRALRKGLRPKYLRPRRYAQGARRIRGRRPPKAKLRAWRTHRPR